MKLRGKVAVLTGGAGGIGVACARRFLDEGARVVLWDLDEAALEKARRTRGAAGDGRETRALDVTDAEAVAAAFDDAESQVGEVDVVLNNAGITRDAMLHKMEDGACDAVVRVNLRGVFVVGREAARRMRERGHGVILNTSSVVGLYGNIGQSNYAATKAGVIAMTQTWAKELGPKGVRVNALAPGYVSTEMMATVPEKVLDLIRSRTPMRRLARPEEIAAGFAFLASDDASFVTGHVLSVDGGLVV